MDCNFILGYADDNPQILLNGIRYLKVNKSSYRREEL